VEFEPNLSSAQYISNGKQFSTLDSDNDAWSGNCAVSWGCGWWYEMCSTSILNRDLSGFWDINDVQASRMLVKANCV